MEKEISSETLTQGIRKFKTKLCKRDIARALRDRVDLNTLYLLLLYWNYKLALSFLLVKTFFLQKLTKLFVRKMMLSFLWSQVLGDVKFCSILTLSFVWRSSFACQVLHVKFPVDIGVLCGCQVLWWHLESFVWTSNFMKTSSFMCMSLGLWGCQVLWGH